MEIIESLKRKIKTAEELKSVVKTMKALAAVNIRQYEKAVESLAEYNRTIEMGLQIVLKNRPQRVAMEKPAPKNHLGLIVFGSDQGMCGQFNDQIISHAINTMNNIGIKLENRMILAVGMRVTTRLEDAGLPIEESLPVPVSIFSITPMVQDILMKIENWHLERGIDQIVLFYNRHFGSAYYHPHTVHLLPVDLEQFQHFENEEWPSRVLPIFTMDWDQLFSSLIRQYLFISLYRAFAESLASENVSRLASMQGAERNISERLDEINAQLRQQRQMSITEELLDIVAGFEALNS